MISKEQTARINELYKKQKETGLTEEEKKEQEKLRRLYIDAMKESLKVQLKNIKVVTPEEYEKMKGKDGCSCGCENGTHKHNSECSCKDEDKHKDCGCKH